MIYYKRNGIAKVDYIRTFHKLTPTFFSYNRRYVINDRDNGMKETQFASKREIIFVCESTF